jgi:hypothetical protein
MAIPVSARLTAITADEGSGTAVATGVVMGLRLAFHNVPPHDDFAKNWIADTWSDQTMSDAEGEKPSNEICSGGDGTAVVLSVDSKDVVVFADMCGVNSSIVLFPCVMVMSQDVMPRGRLMPVAPFVVIVPEIVNPFWAAGKFTTP